MVSTAVGLDIGSSAVRAAEVRLDRRGWVLRRCGRVPLPVGAVEGGVVRDEAVVGAALRELWSSAGFSTRTVRLGVGSGSVLVRQLELDWMAEPDLRRSLRYQVADLLPVPVEDANLAHVTLGERDELDHEGRSRRLVRILLVATARDVVDGLVRAATAARLRTDLADLAAFASVRAAIATVPPDPDQVAAAPGSEAVVDIGAETLTVVVHEAGSPQFVRVASGLGSALLSRALVEQTGCAWDQAEQLKRAPGHLPAPGDQPRTREQVVLQEAVTRLLGEVRNTVEFHASGDPTRLPRRVVLTGGGGLLPGLREQAAVALRCPVDLMAPGVTTGTELAVEPDLAVAVGLGLGAAA